MVGDSKAAEMNEKESERRREWPEDIVQGFGINGGNYRVHIC